MTIANERLVDYLGLEFELCYRKASGEAVWILADKIRRTDEIALEMLRIFNRFMRIGKSLERDSARRSNQAPNEPDQSISNPNNAPYAHCIGVRIRCHEHVAAFHPRPGIDPGVLANAPRLMSSGLLDGDVPLRIDDPILELLTAKAKLESCEAERTPQRPKRPKPRD